MTFPVIQNNAKMENGSNVLFLKDTDQLKYVAFVMQLFGRSKENVTIVRFRTVQAVLNPQSKALHSMMSVLHVLQPIL